MQLEAKTLEIDELSSKCDKLMKNQKEFEDDISSLNRKMHVLNDALSLTETDRDKRQLEIDSLNKKLQKQRIEMEKVVETLKGLCFSFVWNLIQHILRFNSNIT